MTKGYGVATRTGMYWMYLKKKCIGKCTGKGILFHLCTGVTGISLTCVLECTGISQNILTYNSLC